METIADACMGTQPRSSSAKSVHMRAIVITQERHHDEAHAPAVMLKAARSLW
jgi:hypothetical protein